MSEPPGSGFSSDDDSKAPHAKKLRLCPRCKLGNAAAAIYCRNCGHSFVEGAKSVLQPEPEKLASTWRRTFPDIYRRVRNPSKLDLRSFVALFYRPTQALVALYQSASLRGALLLVVLTGVCLNAVTQSGRHYDAWEFAGHLMYGLFFWTTNFALVALLATAFLRLVFGRADMITTLTLVGYAQAVLVSALILGAFAFSVVDQLSAEAYPGVIAFLAIVVPVGLYSLRLLVMAIGLANDVTDNSASFASTFGIFGSIGVHVALRFLIALPEVASGSLFGPVLF